MKLQNIILAIIVISLPIKNGYCAENGQINKIIPPIPVSQYKIPYIENSQGQIKAYVKTGFFQKRDYQLYLPNGPSVEPRPAILLFHGATRTGVSLVENWKSVADKYNLILIGPTAKQGVWNFEYDGANYIDAVLKDANLRSAIDLERLYMFGHSSGANYVLFLSCVYSNKFAASAIHAGMFMNESDYQIIDAAKRKIPISFFIGTRDDQFPVKTVISTANAFIKRNHPIGFNVLEGHNHWYYTLAPYINESAWLFLKQYKL